MIGELLVINRAVSDYEPACTPVITDPIFRGGRGWDPVRREHVFDWILQGATQGSTVLGQKPTGFCFWVFNLLGLRPGDELDDLFPGSGAVGRAWDEYRQQVRLPTVKPKQLELA